MTNLKNIINTFKQGSYDAIAIGGQTASGKSAFALSLAKELGGEIIGSDSRQIYQDMIIGTGALVKHEMEGIPHHLIGTIPPSMTMNAATYKEMAYEKIKEILGRNQIPILVGGTGLYLDSVIFNFSFSGEEIPMMSPWKILLVIISGDTNVLNQKIDQRHREMFESSPSIIDETIQLLENGYARDHEAMTSIGYRESMQYIDGKMNLESAIKQTQQEARSYAKRQRTWFRRLLRKYPGIIIQSK